MADIATPSAIAISTMDAGADPNPKTIKSKPEKPNEEEYKESLSQAEKAYQAAQEKFVRLHSHKRPWNMLLSRADLILVSRML